MYVGSGFNNFHASSLGGAFGVGIKADTLGSLEAMTVMLKEKGIPVRKADGRHDWGRYEGVKALRASRFNLLSKHDDVSKVLESLPDSISTPELNMDMGREGE
mgnify:CR=1 FL=1